MSKKSNIARNTKFINVLIEHLVGEDEYISDPPNGALSWISTKYTACKESAGYLERTLNKGNLDLRELEELREDVDDLFELLDDVREKIKKKVNKRIKNEKIK